MGINDFLDDIPDTDSVKEVKASIEENPLVKFYDGLRENELVVPFIDESIDMYDNFLAEEFHSREQYEKIFSFVKDTILSFSARDIERFWVHVESRKNEYDEIFAGCFVGMLISYLRDRNDDTPLRFYAVSLDEFCGYGRHITHVEVDVVKGGFFFAGTKLASNVHVGSMQGYEFFTCAGKDGRISDVSIEYGLDRSIVVPDFNEDFSFARNLSNITINGVTLESPSWEEVQEVLYGN